MENTFRIDCGGKSIPDTRNKSECGKSRLQKLARSISDLTEIGTDKMTQNIIDQIIALDNEQKKLRASMCVATIPTLCVNQLTALIPTEEKMLEDPCITMLWEAEGERHALSRLRNNEKLSRINCVTKGVVSQYYE